MTEPSASVSKLWWAAPSAALLLLLTLAMLLGGKPPPPGGINSYDAGRSGFRAAYLAKGRMRSVLEAMPVHVVLDPNTTVLGAAALAADQATLAVGTRHIPATTP